MGRRNRSKRLAWQPDYYEVSTDGWNVLREILVLPQTGKPLDQPDIERLETMRMEGTIPPIDGFRAIDIHQVIALLAS